MVIEMNDYIKKNSLQQRPSHVRGVANLIVEGYRDNMDYINMHY